MQLKKLTLSGFRNIADAEIAPDGRIVCFTGDNGAGKSNMLDSVHYLAMGRAPSAMPDSQSVAHGGDYFMVEGEFEADSGSRQTVLCSFKRGTGKILKRNGKPYEKLSDHIGSIPLVIVSPSDYILITDAAEERRRWLDSFLSQLDKEYLAAVMRYRQVLGERNRLLKSGSFADGSLMEVLDIQLVEAGEKIHERRGLLIGRLAPLVAEYYRLLSGDREQVELAYRSELDGTPFAEILARTAERDAALGFTASGVHRDDMKMTIGGYPLRKYGSQGQQKSFLIALKLAQYTLLAEDKGEKPILLLDDIFDKLDMDRVRQLMAIVSEDAFGQIFVTDHSRERLSAILESCAKPYCIYGMSAGEI